MTPAEFVDEVIATQAGRNLVDASGVASHILERNGIDPLNTEHRRIVAIGVILGSSLGDNDPDGLKVDGLVRALTYGMEPTS